ncbi:hypothetical protein BW686_14970 [Pseudomonas syringae]|uniref:Uncharacterized protein n=1 Tax=Pseudomonas syringae TaxID=317 RepID=A0A244EPJ5_PSESX|nr:hypothetical protein [Pseudomonas syringae]MCI3944732.1 hypothetical protein [Pseudomonas syringae]OUM06407.1 hypothetical protein BW686_14970 [Pseudomonas syringae]
MKRILILPFVAMSLFSLQASAVCLNIKNTYSGTIAANSEIVAYGPFQITSASGCSSANISSTAAALGTGSAPALYIDKQSGSGWVQVAQSTLTGKASYLEFGGFGTYRIRHVNTTSAVRAYSGTTAYSR